MARCQSRVVTPGPLYIVVDDALLPGQQIAQSIHAARAFQAAHHDVELAWFEISNTIAVLRGARGDIAYLTGMAELLDIPFATFCEPDLGNRVTAVALLPILGTADAVKRRLRSLTLALS